MSKPIQSVRHNNNEVKMVGDINFLEFQVIMEVIALLNGPWNYRNLGERKFSWHIHQTIDFWMTQLSCINNIYKNVDWYKEKDGNFRPCLYTQINHITLINIVTQFAMFSFKPLECSDNIIKFSNVVTVYINIPCNTVYCYSSIQYLGGSWINSLKHNFTREILNSYYSTLSDSI